MLYKTKVELFTVTLPLARDVLLLHTIDRSSLYPTPLTWIAYSHFRIQIVVALRNLVSTR